MKKLLVFVLALTMLVGLVSCGGASVMTMGTGGTSGTYYGYGGILGNQIKTSTGITVNVVSTDGSKANILGIDAGNYQLGTVQSDVMAYAAAGERSFEKEGALDSFRVIGGLYAEAVQLVTMDPAIKSVADLAGKKVSIGAAGSGVYFNAIDILGAAGLTEADIQPPVPVLRRQCRCTQGRQDRCGIHRCRCSHSRNSGALHSGFRLPCTDRR